MFPGYIVSPSVNIVKRVRKLKALAFRVLRAFDYRPVMMFL